MRFTATVVVLAALASLLGCLAVSPIRLNALDPAPWEVCESLGPTACADQGDRCTLCKDKFAGKELCFRNSIAKALPSFIFDCDATDPPEGVYVAAKPAPWEVCEAYNPHECQENANRCSLCRNKATGVELCFEPTIADSLPAMVFECSTVEPLSTKASANPGPAPAPWVPCESYNSTQCAAHDADCALCTVEGKKGKKSKEMCFGIAIAKTLPPFIFHCKLPEIGAGEA